MRLVILLGLAVGAGLPGRLHAQSDSGNSDRWQITREDGSYLWDLRLVRLTGDSLVFRQADTLGVVRVQKIRELRLIQKTTVHVGEGSVRAETLNALVGGDDEVYDFLALDFAGRIRAIQQIFLSHPPSP